MSLEQLLQAGGDLGCHGSLAGLPTPGGRGAGATLGSAQSSDPHTPTGFGAWDYIAGFLGLFGGRLCLAQLGSVQPSPAWPCQHSGSALQECGAAGCARPGCPCWGGDPTLATGGCAGAPVSLSLPLIAISPVAWLSVCYRAELQCLPWGYFPALPCLGYTFAPLCCSGEPSLCWAGTRAVKLASGTGAGQHWTRGVGQRGAESCPGEEAGGSVPVLGPFPAVATPGRLPADIFQVRRQHVPPGRGRGRERGRQPPPRALVCHSMSGGCTVGSAGILLGFRFWGIWNLAPVGW